MINKPMAIRYTMGDESTDPGGIILRRAAGGEFMCHNFVRKAGSLEPTSFFWGYYSYDEGEAWQAFADKVQRAVPYCGRGGGLIQQEAVAEGC